MIVLYDVPSKKGSWSAMTWRIRWALWSNHHEKHSQLTPRYALNYKGIQFETQFIEYPDIEPLSKKIGAKPTGTNPDGSPLYTIPFIYDEDTKTAVSETIDIALYLDKRFPDTPCIVPPGTKGLQLAFIETTFAVIAGWSRPLWLSLLAGTSRETRLLNDATADYLFAKHGVPPPLNEDECNKRLDQGEQELAKIAAWYAEEDVFISGADPCFADFCVAAALITLKVIWGAESGSYTRLGSWQGGRWARLMKALEKYE
jgi:glutathione S-transferase